MFWLQAAQHAVHDFLQFGLNIMIGCCVMSPCGKTSPSFFCFIAFYLNGMSARGLIQMTNMPSSVSSSFSFCFCILNVRICSFLDILRVYLVNFDTKFPETTGGGTSTNMSVIGVCWLVLAGLGLDCTDGLCF